MARPKRVHTTNLSRDALETVLDLIEIKLQSMEVFDRDDAREAKSLGEARSEIASILGLELAPIVPPQTSSATARTRKIAEGHVDKVAKLTITNSSVERPNGQGTARTKYEKSFPGL